MKNRFLMAAVCGAAMTLMAGTATALPDLGLASTFVQLDWEERPWAAGGGGVSRFTVDGYRDGSGNNTDTGLFGSLNASVYATCFEQDQYLDKSSQWYAVFLGLEHLPTATAGITSEEQGVISAIVGAKFGDDFTEPTTDNRNRDDIKALQAILWEAGETTDNDLLDQTISSTASGGQSGGQAWLGQHYNGLLDPAFVNLFALVHVIEDTNADSGFRFGNKQDFMTYDVSQSPPIPLPAPLLLVGVGLFGLYRFSGLRSCS